MTTRPAARTAAADPATSGAGPAATRIERMLRTEHVLWLSTVGAAGRPHLVPIWFSWDGETVLIASKPGARKVRDIRHNPAVMLALGEPDDDFDVGMLEGVAELVDRPSAAVLPAGHFAKYRGRMAAIGLSVEEFLATYSQVIRVRPTRFLPWHGRTEPASAFDDRPAGDVIPLDRRLSAAIRRVAASALTLGVLSASFA
jgi:PPOX class probable F420-dependent enzyme